MLSPKMQRTGERNIVFFTSHVAINSAQTISEITPRFNTVVVVQHLCYWCIIYTLPDTRNIACTEGERNIFFFCEIPYFTKDKIFSDFTIITFAQYYSTRRVRYYFKKLKRGKTRFYKFAFSKLIKLHPRNTAQKALNQYLINRRET